MFGIPEWAIGVAFIMLAISAGRVLTGRLAPPRLGRGRKWRGDGRDPFGAEELQGRSEEMEDVRARLGELEDVQRRLAEVEERLDFAERLLAQQRAASPIAPPKD